MTSFGSNCVRLDLFLLRFTGILLFIFVFRSVKMKEGDSMALQTLLTKEYGESHFNADNQPLL